MKHLSIIIILILALLAGYPVYAHWDNDVWLMGERQGLQDWDSVLELQCFLELDDAPLVLKSGESFSGQCENYAFQLRDRAREWGRLLDVEILTPREFKKYYGKRGGYHAINKAIIGNEWWYVDVSGKELKLWHPLNLD